ncbi:MAG TPA: Mpo1-like protein [Steroidobacteraceae bacterium]
MRTVEQWLDEYGESHQNAANKTLHWICVPVIVVSLVGLLWSLPVPRLFREVSALLNWGTLLLFAGLIYYFRMSRSLALGMALFVMAVGVAILWLQKLPWALWAICAVLFAIAWIGQFIGHHYEGRRPSFLQDLQFLLIGPLWLLSFIYRKLRIPY